MKELKAKLSRYLSAVLMVAMVITSTPQAAMAAVEADPLADPIVETIGDGTDGEIQDVSQPDVEETEQEEIEQEDLENVGGEEEPVEVEPTGVEPMGEAENPDKVTFINADNATINVSVPSDTTSFSDDDKEIVSDNIVFTVTPKDHYIVKSVSCSVADSARFSGSNGTYTYIGDPESAAEVSITVTLEECEWQVTITENESEVQYKKNGSYVGYEAPFYVSGGSLNFKVVANEDYEVKSVSAGSVAMQKPEDGVYTLTGIDEATTITVNTAAKPKVTFALTGATVSYNTTGADDAYTTYDTGDINVSTNATIYFKVTPAVGYKAPIDVSEGVTVSGDVYSKEITSDTSITVAATPIYHTVSFNMTGVTVQYNTVSAGDVYVPYDGTPVVVSGGKIYYKLTPTEGYENEFSSSNTDKGTYDSASKSFSYEDAALDVKGGTTTITVEGTAMNTVSFNTVGAIVKYNTVSTGNFTTFTNKPVPVAKGSRLWFTVEKADNYTTPITVKESESDVTTSENGIYYVEMSGSDHVIDVKATEIKHKVSFNCVSGNFASDGIQYKVGAGNYDKYDYNTSFDVHQGTTVKFKLNLADAYEKPVVKVGTTTLTASADGEYSWTVANDTTISITTTKKATVSFNVAKDSPFENIYYGFTSNAVTSEYLGKEIPVAAGDVFYYSFELKEKYVDGTLSVKLGGIEQTPDENDIYHRTGITGDVIITATAVAPKFNITFNNPTEAVIESLSVDKIPNADFDDTTKTFEVEKKDDVEFKVTASGNYAGRKVVVKNGAQTYAGSGAAGNEYSITAEDDMTIEILPDVKYTFTNSGNAISFKESDEFSYSSPSTAATISKSNIASGTDYSFKVTPDSGKVIDYVTIDGKEATAVSKEGDSSIYVVNAKVDTEIVVQSDTKYEVSFTTDNGAVAKVGKDYSETISNNKSKVIAGAKEFKFKAQAADSYQISSVSINGAKAALAADKDGVYTISAGAVKLNPNVDIKSEKQKHKVTFVNGQKATIKYEIGGTVSEGSTNEITDTKKVVDDVVVGSTFMVEAPEGSQVMAVVRGKDKAKVTAMNPDAQGIYTIDSLNADETITITCRKNATGIKFGKSDLSENEIEQTANTVATYTMDVVGVDKNFDPSRDLSLTVGKGPASSVSMSEVDYNTISVKVITPYDYTDNTVTDVEFAIKEGTQVLSTFKVIATIPEIKAPAVAVSDIRDDSAVLTLTDKSKQVVKEGNVYYHISATQLVSDNDVPINLATLNNIDGSFEDGNNIYVRADMTSKTFTTKVRVNFRAFTGDDLSASTGYNVSVNACIAKDGGADKVLDNSESTMLKKPFNLNASKYETNLKLGKAASKYISGQAGVPIAKVTWSKGTTKREFDTLRAYGTKQTISDGDLVVDGDIVYLKQGVALENTGTYTVVAQPQSKNSNAKETILKFKVVQGISELDSTNKDVEILRAKGKKVTYKLPALIYNGGITKPASKKVTYTLSRVDGVALTANDKLIKVANGKVTIDKKYVFDAALNYKVTVKANDFAENAIAMEYTFKIKETGATELKYLYVCELENNQYTPINTKTAIGNGEYYIIVTKEAVSGVIAYNSTNIVKTSEYSLKSSKSSVKVTSNDGKASKADWETYAYSIDPKAYAKDVTFTATAVDGGKGKIALKKVTFEDYPEALWFDVYTENAGVAKADTSWTVSTLNNETFTIKDYARLAGTSAEMKDTLVDYKVSADKGLKIVTNSRGERTALFTGKALNKEGKATGTLTYTSYKMDKGKRVKVTTKLTITNGKNWVKTVAPSVKQLNTLYAERTNTQSISFNAKKSLPATANKVRITKAVGNTNASYANLYANSGLNGYFTVDDKIFNLPLKTAGVQEGTYKYIITFGHEAGSEFVEDTGATTLAIKVVKEKAKVTTSYTLSEVVPSVGITGKFSKGTSVSGTELLNANIGGTVNKFNTYFELSADGKSIGLKAAKNVKTEADAKALQDAIAHLTNKANKNDLVGYLAYDVDNSMLTDTVKVTVKIATNATSAKAFKSKVKTISVSGTDIKLQYNKKAAVYAYAYTDASDSVSLNAAVDIKGNVIISGTDAEATGNVKGAYVYVLKADSPYVSYVNTLATPAAKNAAVEKYGVKVNLGTIKVK